MMTWDSKFGPVITIAFESTSVGSWATNTRNFAALAPIATSCVVPTDTVFYPVYASAQFESSVIDTGSLTFKLGGPNNQDIPGTAETVISTQGQALATLRFNSARSCAVTGNGVNSITPIFQASTNWGNDTATGVVVLLSGYLQDTQS
jgi:hypothetical protein